MFCDEINLPDMDEYGTQRVISFLRQMVEHNGFYRTRYTLYRAQGTHIDKNRREYTGIDRYRQEKTEIYRNRQE